MRLFSSGQPGQGLVCRASGRNRHLNACLEPEAWDAKNACIGRTFYAHPPPEPSVRSAAFTPLQLPIVQELFTLKRRKRRAPVQRFNAQIVSGKSLPRPNLGWAPLHRSGDSQPVRAEGNSQPIHRLGSGNATKRVPPGTEEYLGRPGNPGLGKSTSTFFFRPDGAEMGLLWRVPAMNRWAIFGGPSGTRRTLFPRRDIATTPCWRRFMGRERVEMQPDIQNDFPG
jgi:hypothetical protein